MYLFDIFGFVFFVLLFLTFGSLSLLMCCGPDLKNSDLSIMSDNQSPRDIHELNNENHDDNKDN